MAEECPELRRLRKVNKEWFDQSTEYEAAIRELRAQLATVQQWIVQHCEPPRDHACAECAEQCRFHSELIIDGFRCVYHTALAVHLPPGENDG